MATSPWKGVTFTGHRGKLAAIAVVVLLIVVLAIFFRPGAASGPGAASLDPIVAQAQVLDAVERQRSTLAEASLLTLRGEGREVLRIIDRVSQQRASWDQNVRSLLQNDEGRRIAADPDRVARFITLLHATLPDPQAIADQRERVSKLLAPIEEALAGGLAKFSPDDGFQRQLVRERQAAQAQERDLANHEGMLAALTAEAAQAVAAPSGDVLRAKVDQFEHEKSAAQLRELQQALDKVAEESATRIAALRVQQAREEAASQERKLETEMLRKKAEDPTLQQRYQVFLAKGRYLFSRQDGPSPQYADIPAPASLRRLREVGVLDNEFVFWATATGGRHFQHPAQKHGYRGQGDNNDRPVTWTGYPTTEEGHKLIRQRYLEFLELAPIWVEMGLLRP